MSKWEKLIKLAQKEENLGSFGGKVQKKIEKKNPNLINTRYLCGDQLLVNCLYIQVLYKQDAVSVTRLQCICGISDFELIILSLIHI